MCKEAWVKKKHCCQKHAFSATVQPILLMVPKCAEPPEHLRSEISSRALATFQNIGKARKQEAIWIKCVACSYSIRFYTVIKIYKVCNSFRTLLLSLTIPMLTKTEICSVQSFLQGKHCMQLLSSHSTFSFLYPSICDACIANNQKKISKISTVLLPWKNFCGRSCYQGLTYQWKW